MRLAIDCGNSNTDLGLFCGERGNIVHRWRFMSFRERNLEEHVVLFRHFLSSYGGEKKVEQITVSCVCSALLDSVTKACEDVFGLSPLLVTNDVINAPSEAGGDRVANAVSVMNFHQTPAIVADFGTATAFDLISDQGLESCVIAQGIEVFVASQNSIARHLPKVDLPQKAQGGLCRHTIASMEEGLHQGYRGMVLGIISSMENCVEVAPRLISTGGGWTRAKSCIDGIFHEHAPDLTLRGLDVIGLNK